MKKAYIFDCGLSFVTEEDGYAICAGNGADNCVLLTGAEVRDLLSNLSEHKGRVYTLNFLEIGTGTSVSVRKVKEGLEVNASWVSSPMLLPPKEAMELARTLFGYIPSEFYWPAKEEGGELEQTR